MHPTSDLVFILSLPRAPYLNTSDGGKILFHGFRVFWYLTDFDLDVSHASEAWRQAIENSDNLAKFTEKTEVCRHAGRQKSRVLVLADGRQDEGACMPRLCAEGGGSREGSNVVC